MSNTFTCDCGQRFETSDDNEGRLAHCPDCGRELIIPRGGEPLLDPTPEGAEFAIGDATSRKAIAARFLASRQSSAVTSRAFPPSSPRQPRRPFRPRAASGPGMVLAGIGLGVFGCRRPSYS